MDLFLPIFSAGTLRLVLYRSQEHVGKWTRYHMFEICRQYKKMELETFSHVFVSVCVRHWWSGTGGCVWSSAWCLSSWSTASNTSCPTSQSAGGTMWVKHTRYTPWIIHRSVLKRSDDMNLSCCSGSWMCCCVTGWAFTAAWRRSVGSPWSRISGRDCGTSQHTSKMH